MSLDPTWLFLSLFPSGIGFVLFIYGRKQQRWPQLVAGLLLMAYPYFVDGALWLAIIGAGIGLALWVAIRLDW
jgi:hypothetical protein